MKPEQLLLFVEIAEWAGLISSEQSRRARQQIGTAPTCSPEFCQNLLRQLALGREHSKILWQMVQIVSPRTMQQTQLEASEIAPEQLAPEWRQQLALAEQILQSGLVSLNEINQILEQLQLSPQELSLGQVLLRRRLISPQQLVQLQQQSLRQKDTLSYRIVKESGQNSWQLAAEERVHMIGPYCIAREIARGGMGIVYEAIDSRLQRRVALKTLIAQGQAEEQAVERFQKEAQMTAALQHPGIVPIHEVGIDNGVHYFTMDYIDGMPLDDYVRQGRLSLRKRVQLLQQVALALAYAHSKGVIHRDIKPANILVDTDGRPRLTDFGLAKRQDGSVGLTVSGLAIGTPAYMPPEQAEGKLRAIDQRSDIYSLGAVFYEMLAGRPPFTATSLAEALIAVINDEPVAVATLVPGIPRDIDTICMKCLEKKHERRYQSMEQLAADLDCFLHGEPIQARSLSRLEKSWRWARCHKIFTGMTTTLLLAVVIYLWGKFSNLHEIEKAKTLAQNNAIAAQHQARKAREAQSQAEKRLKEVQRQRAISQKHLAESWFYRGVLLGKIGEFQNAIAAFSQAIQLDPQLYRAYSNRGVLLLKQGDATKALGDVNQAITLAANDSEAYVYRGEINAVFGKYPRALHDFATALRLNPKCVEAYCRRGFLYLRSNRHSQAIEDFNRALQLLPGNLDAIFGRAEAYTHLGQYQRAWDDYRQCRQRDRSYRHTEISERLRCLQQRIQPDRQRE